MQITVTNLGKRYNRQWIFRGIQYIFEAGKAYAITGPNGSGKSTLLQVIAGSLEKSEGTVEYSNNETNASIAPELIYKYLSFSAPYFELVEELTLSEFLNFHFGLKPVLQGYQIKDMLQFIELEHVKNRAIRNFSSGMKQRVKLAQAFFTNVPIIMLDEPTANFDIQGIELYNRMVQELQLNRTLIICSNDEAEISFCDQRLSVMDWKIV